jgi:cytochrome c553
MKMVVLPFLLAVTTLLTAMPLAAEPSSDDLRLASLAATCANCHGTRGFAVEGSVVPGLAGQPAAYLIEQVKAFRSGAKPATVMHQLAKGYSDAQIDAIAAYYAAQKR